MLGMNYKSTEDNESFALEFKRLKISGFCPKHVYYSLIPISDIFS